MVLIDFHAVYLPRILATHNFYTFYTWSLSKVKKTEQDSMIHVFKELWYSEFKF